VTITHKFQDLAELTRLYNECEDKSAEVPGYDEDGPSITLDGFIAAMDMFFAPGQLFTAFSHPRWEAFACAHFRQCGKTVGSVVTRLEEKVEVK